MEQAVFFLRYRDVMCVRCRVLDARRTLCVDPGPEQPVTILGHFCLRCAEDEQVAYARGRKAWRAPGGAA